MEEEDDGLIGVFVENYLHVVLVEMISTNLWVRTGRVGEECEAFLFELGEL